MFSVVLNWFGKLRGMFGGSSQLAKTLDEVEKVAAQALPAVYWVGDVVVAAISNSHLPVADIIAAELQKTCPDLKNVDIVAAKLASKDRADMLLSLAVIFLQHAGVGGKLSILRAAVEIAHLIYSAQKGK